VNTVQSPELNPCATGEQTAPVSGTLASVEDAIRVLDVLRRRSPLVHCMTNNVVTAFTANVLLAIGASPAMVEHPGEAADFAAIADALLVNLGTVSAATAAAMRGAVKTAGAAGTPWVLDPVAVGALHFRTRLANQLLGHGPAVIRGNASEILCLAGATGAAGRGVDSTAGSHGAVTHAVDLARREGTTIALSGAVDFITDGSTVLEVHNGHPTMTRVTGVGCALGALVAACCAVEGSPLDAAAAATTILTVAGEVAAERSHGPGSFAVSLLDALHDLDPATLRAHTRAEP
jgi:hydroxyethylthiazole kinase